MHTMEDVARHCDGMLPQAVYQEISKRGQRGGVIVEVGTALGAGTVALALGLKSSGRSGRIYSFDPMLGGPRRQISGVSDRVSHVKANLKHFGVDHLVELVTASLPDGIGAIPEGEDVSVLVIDADGCIDREMSVIYPRLAPDADIVIDDVRDLVRLRRMGWSTWAIDSKQRLSFLLVEALKRMDAISEGVKIKDTYFGRKCSETSTIDAERILEAYRGVIFTRSNYGIRKMLRSIAIRRLEGWAPALLMRARVMHRRSVGSPLVQGTVAPATAS